MNYRARAELKTDPRLADLAAARHALARAYSNVFTTPEGRAVLNDIVQRICGVDAIVTASEPMHAVAILERANVGKQIAALAAGPSTERETKIEVVT